MTSKVVRHNGELKISIDGQLYMPLSFKSFRPNPKNVSEFYTAGVRLFSILTSGITSAIGVPYSLYGESWVGDGQYDFSKTDDQVDMFIENAPDAYFAIMLQLDTRDWYLEEHPNVPNSFTHLSQIACDEEWKRAAAEYMKAAIRHIEEKYGDKIYAYFLLGGTTTEWFSHFDCEVPNDIKNNGYKQWMGDDTATLPSPERLNATGKVFLGEDEKDVYSARKFHNELIADLILYFVGEAQSVIQHQKLIGLYYGYLFELGSIRLYDDGSLGYEKVFLSPDIDIISSPSAYGYRKLFDPSAFMVTKKTLDIHNKIYYLEFDHITHSAPTTINDGMDLASKNRKLVAIPGADSKCKNETETLNLMYRDFVLCKGNSAGLWWFDMFDGWFRSKGVMDSVAQMINISNKYSQVEQNSVAEIAVFAEGEAMYRARKTEDLPTLCLSNIRRTLAECGAPYDLYSISDLSSECIDKYKFYIFVNQYDISEETKKRIEEKCKQKGKAILWLYAPDYANDGQCDVENITKVTEIKVVESEKTHGGIVYNENVYEYPLSAPYFSVEDACCEPLSYFDDGAVAVAQKSTEQYNSIYCSTCNLPSDLLRLILLKNGVYVYSNNSGVYTYPNSLFVGVYNSTEDAAILNLPKDGTYIDEISGDTFYCEEGKIILPKKDMNAFLLRRISNDK